MRISGYHYRLCAALLAVVVCAPAASVLRAADLTAAEKPYLTDATKHLNQFQINLNLALESAGSGEDAPTGTKGKLARVRLDSAQQSSATVAARLEKLPADNADVKAVQAKYDELKKAAAALEDRLAGKGKKPADETPEAPADKPGNSPAKPAAPAGKEQKLDYRAEDTLKIARGNTREVAALAGAIEKTVAEVDAIKDKSTVPHQSLAGAFDRIKEARRKTGFAEAQFKKLPADHSSVKAALGELSEVVARVDASEKALAPIYKQVLAQIDPANYPDLAADNQRIEELTSQLAVGDLQTNRETVAELVKQIPAMKDEIVQVAKKYAPLLNQKTGESEYLNNNGKQLISRIKQFEESLAEEKKTLPGQFDEDLKRATTLADEAVREAKPLFFTGGVVDALKAAQEKLVLYEVLDPDGAKAAAAKLDATREAIKKQEASLADEIIAGNNLPPDRYAGADKADLIARATAGLKEQHPDAAVLTARIPSEQWKRETKWRYQNGEAYKIDHSRLQVQVVIKRDDKIAEVHPINLWKDHLQGDVINAYPLYAKEEVFGPHSLMLLEKVK